LLSAALRRAEQANAKLKKDAATIPILPKAIHPRPVNIDRVNRTDIRKCLGSDAENNAAWSDILVRN